MDFLSSKEFFLKSVVESTPLPIGVYEGPTLKIVLANQSMLDAWGKGNDVVGKLYTEVLPELENQEIFDQIRDVWKTGIPYHAKDSRVDLFVNGTLNTYYFNYSFIPLYNQEGEIYAIMNTGAEVTDLNFARQQIKDAEEKLRLAIESADLGVYESNLITNEMKVSDRFKAIFGIQGSITTGTVMQKFHPEDLSIVEDAHFKVSGSEKVSYEARVLIDEKETRWIRVNGKIAYNQEEIPAVMLGVVQDITAEKRFTKQLSDLVEEKTKDLLRSNEDLVQFAHVVSHDLKEPVRKIKLYNDVLKKNFSYKLDKKGKEYLNKMQFASDRIFLIIDDVLSYSTFNSSGYPPQTIDLNEIINNIKSDLELVIHEKKAILVLDKLPSIEGATILIHQLFYNLINNALKFSKAEEPPRVIISSSIIEENDRSYARIIVKDNGIGIDPENAERIFEAFERLHSKTEYEGTGLGLSLCRKIAERHHGTIRATGQKDEGSEFIVSLPLKQNDETI